MIINLLINLVVLIVGAVFSLLPIVTTLPTIGGYDIDSALSSGIGSFHVFATAFWPFQYILDGFIFLMTYYIIKMVFKFIMGARSFGH